MHIYSVMYTICVFNKTIEIHFKHALWLHMCLHYPKYAIEGCQMLNFSIDRQKQIPEKTILKNKYSLECDQKKKHTYAPMTPKVTQ